MSQDDEIIQRRIEACLRETLTRVIAERDDARQEAAAHREAAENSENELRRASVSIVALLDQIEKLKSELQTLRSSAVDVVLADAVRRIALLEQEMRALRGQQ